MVIFLTNLTLVLIFLIPFEAATMTTLISPVVGVEGVLKVVVAKVVVVILVVVAATTAAAVVVAAATAATIAATAMRLPSATTLGRVPVAFGGTATTVGGSVSRRLEGASPRAMEHLDTLIEIQPYRKDHWRIVVQCGR